MFTEQIRVPKERVAVFIGKTGAARRHLERLLGVHIIVDSKEGIVTLQGEVSLSVFEAKPVVRAIARGFSPATASELSKENSILEVVDITGFAGKSKKKLLRLKSRCIGVNGKARSTIEEMTSAHICVYGKTVAILGSIDSVLLARKAIESLLKGAPHSNVYRAIIESRRRFTNL